MSRRRFCTLLHLDKDGNKLWNLTRAMNDEGNKSAPIILQHNDQLISGRQAPDHLIKQYAEVSDIELPPHGVEEVREAQRAYANNQESL